MAINCRLKIEVIISNNTDIGKLLLLLDGPWPSVISAARLVLKCGLY